MKYSKLYVEEGKAIKEYIVMLPVVQKFGINVIHVSHQIIGTTYTPCDKYIPVFRVTCIEPIELTDEEVNKLR